MVLMFVRLNEDSVRLCFGQHELEGSWSALLGGDVLDQSTADHLLRAWRVGDEIHFADQFDHDRAWTHDVVVFPATEPSPKIVKPTRIAPLHAYLAEGHGLPPAPAK